MYPNLRPRAIGIDLELPADIIPLAKRHGFGGIDLSRECLTSDQAADDVRHAIEGAALQWGLFGLGVDPFTDRDDFNEQLPRIDTAARRAARAGCTRCYNHIWSSHAERPFDANFAWHVERLKQLVDILAPHGIDYSLEFLGPHHLRTMHPHPFIHSLDGLLQLIDAAAVGEQVGLAIDFFHCYTAGHTPADLDRLLAGRHVTVVHANDAQPGRAPAEQLDYERAMPMATGVLDGPGYLRAVAKHGFTGPVFAEPFKPEVERFKQLPPDTAAAETAACLQKLFAAVQDSA